jgi:hypothetical protein
VIVGSGKTVLTLVLLLVFDILFANDYFRSSVIDYLYCQRTKSDESITYFFPRFDSPTSLSATTVLRSIIRQFLTPDDVTGEVERQLERFGSNVDIETIDGLLQYCISKVSTLYIVIDALDEFEKEERNILLQSFSSVVSISDSKAKLFLVSRISISEDIRRWFPACQQKYTIIHEVQADIETYTREVITARQSGKLISEEQLILQDPLLAQEIIEALINGADGM